MNIDECRLSSIDQQRVVAGGGTEKERGEAQSRARKRGVHIPLLVPYFDASVM